ncbi:MAG: acetyltransferase, ribosomal protein N-acetylase [Sphingobacteriales bacterium]|nr:acetyltransferase, ribosomal protein N-acetylase [Sphingobacteriales bacterium]
MEFTTSEKYKLEDERVLLRPLERNDNLHLEYFAENEPELFKYSLSLVAGKENLKNYINLTLSAREKETEYPFIVFDKLTGKYAGTTRFYDIQLKNKSLQLGYTWYGKEFHGSGLNKHCKFLLLEFAFETIGIERVEFRANNLNERSKAAMISIGCTVEGVLRQSILEPNGFRRDTIVLSILREEWQNGIKERLQAKL